MCGGMVTYLDGDSIDYKEIGRILTNTFRDRGLRWVGCIMTELKELIF